MRLLPTEEYLCSPDATHSSFSIAAATLSSAPFARAAKTIEWTYFQADEAGCRRTPVLLTGTKVAKGEIKWG